MKANELRIGNYVKYYYQVMSIDIPEYKIEDGADIQVHENFKVFEPIPLTEEWLLKFGFNIKEAVWFSKKTKAVWIRLEVSIKKKRCILFDTKGINYCDILFPKSVHELQNIYFVLTGKELTQKL